MMLLDFIYGMLWGIVVGYTVKCVYYKIRYGINFF